MVTEWLPDGRHAQHPAPASGLKREYPAATQVVRRSGGTTHLTMRSPEGLKTVRALGIYMPPLSIRIGNARAQFFL